jgi:tetratricopeptide (TPR) repeat protein
MESHVRNSLWHLLRANSAEAQLARRRLGVGIAFAVFLSGLLTAIGLAMVVFALSLLLVVLIAAVSAVRAVRRHRDELRRLGRALVTSIAHAFRRAHARARQVLSAGVARLSGVRIAAARRIAQFTSRLRSVGLKREAVDLSAAGVAYLSSLRRSAARRIAQFMPRPRAVDLQREALRLNAAGTKRRRDGAPAEAIPLHTRALEILRDTHDPHATVLVQNNLALALSHAGDDRRATALFEQAAATARRLGDAEQEGRIMANLAVAHRRHGRVGECDQTLRLALTKLRRDSSAYRRVAAELTRAGARD